MGVSSSRRLKAQALGSAKVNNPNYRNNNPTGIGGLGERKHDINRTGANRNEQRFDFWLNFFKCLSKKELKKYEDTLETREQYGAEIIAYEHFKNAKTDLPTFKEISARTEGMPHQHITVKDEFSDMTLEEIEEKIKEKEKATKRYQKND